MRGIVLAFVLSACAHAVPTAPVTDDWPDAASPYREAHSRWTRHADLWHDFVLDLDIYATLASPDWRASFTAARARKADLSGDETKRAVAAEQADAAEVWEVELLVSTRDVTWNDLGRGEQSMWRLVLVGDDGLEVAPLSVREDKRGRGELSVWFPDLDPFHRAYVVRFPRTTADGQPLVTQGRLTLKMGGPQGNVYVRWGEEGDGRRAKASP